MNTILRSSLVVILLSVVISTALFAGDKSSARLVGMGRAFTASSRGLDAVGVNPANLALNDRDATVTLNLVPIGFSIGSDLFNYKIYNDFFTGVPDPNDPNKRIGKYLTDQDKKDILGLFPAGIARTQMDFEIAPLGLSFQLGNFGFAIVPSIQTALNMDLPEGYMKLLLNGFEEGGSTYDLSGTSISSSAIAEVNFSTAYMLPLQLPGVEDISIGVGVKYLVGLAYSTTERYNSSIQTTDIVTYTNPKDGSVSKLPRAINANFDFMQFVAIDTADNKPAGSGLGFDIGASAMLFNSVRVAASVTDIGKIKWDKATKAIVGNSNITMKGAGDQAGQDSLSNAFKGKTVDTTAIEYSLPTAIHIGAEIKVDDIIEALPFRWIVAADIHLGLNNVPGNTKIPQFAFGTELDPLAGWLPLRTGILIGGRDRFAWSAGFGIHLANTFDIDFATQSIAILTNPDSFRTGSITLGMRFRF